MDQKPSSSLLLVGLLATLLCAAGPCHAVRLVNTANVGEQEEFTFGTKAAAETEPLDPSLSDDYDDETEIISHVEFEPALGTTAVPPYNSAAPAPAAAAATAAGGSYGSMKWWLPPSTMPSFPLFPTPGGGGGGMPMPAIPGLPLPGGMPFHPIGGWGVVPAPPAPEQPAPPAAETASTNANDPNAATGGIN